MDQVDPLLGWRLGATEALCPLSQLRREPLSRLSRETLGLGRLAYGLGS